MLNNKKPIGGMLMAAVLLMGLLTPASFREAAGRVTVTDDLMHSKNSCRLFVNGEEAELKPGIYHNAMLLVEEHVAHEAKNTKLGRVSAAEDQYFSLYVDM